MLIKMSEGRDRGRPKTTFSGLEEGDIEGGGDASPGCNVIIKDCAWPYRPGKRADYKRQLKINR